MSTISRILAAPINAFRIKMPSDEQLGLLPFTGTTDVEIDLADRLRVATAEATIRTADFRRVSSPRAHMGDRLYSAMSRSRAREWEDYRTWLVGAFNRLATGAAASPIAAQWVERRAELRIRPRYPRPNGELR